MKNIAVRNSIDPINLIPWMLGVFSFLILLEQVASGLCYNKGVFDGIVFLLVSIAMLKGKEIGIVALALILLCCATSALLYFFPTPVSDFDIPSIFEIAAFSLFVLSFFRHEAKAGVAIFALALVILVLVLLDVASPMLRSYSPIVAFMFAVMGAWLVWKK